MKPGVKATPTVTRKILHCPGVIISVEILVTWLLGEVFVITYFESDGKAAHAGIALAKRARTIRTLNNFLMF